mgnify:CR=1 FL=1
MNYWTPVQIKTPIAKSVLITGASSGIGLEAANFLAKNGANVHAAVRNIDKAKSVLDSKVLIHHLDLSDLNSVKNFVFGFGHEVDVLINNAGVMAIPLARTVQGFEMQIGTNHLGHFALTGQLLPRIKERVISVSSTAHRMGKINFDDLNWEKRYQRWLAYGQSKLANLLFTSELNHRLDESNSKIKAIAVHPGFAATNLQSQTQSNVWDGIMSASNKYMAQSSFEGSWSTLFAITEDIPGNSFVGPTGFGQTKGSPGLVSRSKRAKDMNVAKRLWDLSEELTQTTYKFS